MDQHLGEYLGIEADWSLEGDDAHAVEVISPHTEQPIARVVAAGPAEVDAAVAAARAAIDHGRAPPPRRGAAAPGGGAGAGWGVVGGGAGGGVG
ncbi:aldehyde dehydrogenase family protein, partial [Mycolicibacterium fortuitum]|uniref:aldehyde dehydrogenase family protein n=1 Tax=Mycolicibacterium fortuitum TaxID=1766 RepID=UPI0034CE5871